VPRHFFLSRSLFDEVNNIGKAVRFSVLRCGCTLLGSGSLQRQVFLIALFFQNGRVPFSIPETVGCSFIAKLK